MKVLITGSHGFIGKNLKSRLINYPEIEIVEYNSKDNFNKIREVIDSIDYIFHFAGVCKSSDEQQFTTVNVDLTRDIVELILEKKLQTKLIFTSSIHATMGNDYGDSKKEAEEIVGKLGNNAIIFRLHHVFGKWAKPNSHSVVATFCNNIFCDKPLIVKEDASLEFIYIQDLVDMFMDILMGKVKKYKFGKINYFEKRYPVTVSELKSKLEYYKLCLDNGSMPLLNTEFDRRLFETLISYLDVENLEEGIIKHEDERGYLCELFKIDGVCQVNFSKTYVGKSRAGHYHDSKTEKIVVVNGRAKVDFIDINSQDCKSYFLDDINMKSLIIPAGYYHKVTNVGETDLDLIIWVDNLFDKNNPDTYGGNYEK